MIPPRDMTEKQYAKAQMTPISANETVLFTFPRKIFLMRIKYAKAPFKSSNREKKNGQRKIIRSSLRRSSVKNGALKDSANFINFR